MRLVKLVLVDRMKELVVLKFYLSLSSMRYKGMRFSS